MPFHQPVPTLMPNASAKQRKTYLAYMIRTRLGNNVEELGRRLERVSPEQLDRLRAYWPSVAEYGDLVHQQASAQADEAAVIAEAEAILAGVALERALRQLEDAVAVVTAACRVGRVDARARAQLRRQIADCDRVLARLEGARR